MARRPSGWIKHPEAKQMFLASVEQGDGCWLWSGYRDRDGYGRISVDGRQVPAPRIAYQLFVGPISDGAYVMHRCDNPPCVRPDHLRIGSQAENLQDAAAKGRLSGGRFRIRSVRPSRPFIGQRRPSNWFDLVDAQEMFLQSVRKTETCWEWIGSKKKDGYGIVHVRGRLTNAHRAAYLLFTGPISAGSHVLHSCDNPPCVNPAHLRLGSHADNMREAKERGRMGAGDNHWSRRKPELVPRGDRHHSHTKPETVPRGAGHWTKLKPDRINISGMVANRVRGSAHPQAKLTEADIPIIRADVKGGTPIAHIAKRFGVTRGVIREAALGVTFSHVPGALTRADIPTPIVHRGEGHGNAKLTAAIVKTMRERVLYGRMTMVAVARDLGIPKATARQAIIGETWNEELQ